MNYKSALLCFFIFIIPGIYLNMYAQQAQLFGTVKNAKTGKMLPGTNVFLNKTTVGTFTDEEGTYRINDLPKGSYTLVFSFVGFERVKKAVNFPVDKPKEINVYLKPEQKQIRELTVEEEYPKEWHRNLKKFKEHFLGYSRNRDQTKILNPEVLNFKTNDDAFVATADKPLIIENNALGYEIQFFLSEFHLYNNRISTNGLTRFTRMEPENAQELEEWQQERKRTYDGSFEQFMHALIDEKLNQSGYEISFVNNRRDLQYFNSDGSPREKVGVEIEHPGYLWNYQSLDKIILSLYDGYPYLKIKYKRESPEIRIAKKANIIRSTNQISFLEFPKDKAIIDINSMAFEDPFRATFHGYWAWSSRVPEWLPKNYKFEP